MTTRTAWFCMTVAMAAVAVPLQSVWGQSSPQRTITSNPASVTTAASAPGTIDNMLGQYREMWQKMSVAQQKAFLDSGGSTPEQYEHLLRTKESSATPAPTSPAMPGQRNPSDPRAAVTALDSLTTSLQDLNAIRDGNLNRVQRDGCPPEVTTRLTDLKARLQQDEAELTGVEAPAPAASPAKDRAGTADPLAIANDWYKRSPQSQQDNVDGNPVEHSSAPAAADRESKLLADVLTGGSNTAGPQRQVDSKSPEWLRKQKALEEEIARTKAEISQLSSACAAIKP